MSTEDSSDRTTGAPSSEPTRQPPAPAEPESDAAWRARDRKVRLSMAGLVALLIFVYLIPDIFFSVMPGQAAVIWHRFPSPWNPAGTDVENVHPEGLRAKWPWDNVYIYDIRMQEVTHNFPALSSDGLPIEVEVTIRFRPYQRALGELHKHVGRDYIAKLILPELGAHLRDQISKYRPAELYAALREEIQQESFEALETGLFLVYETSDQPQRVIHVEDVLIRNIKLPAKVADAIDDKLAQEQRLLEYDYRLDKERKESTRKRIEAQGIRDFQDIVTGGISERYLEWKGIDATLELARSPNAKIIVIGAGDGGLPIILGGVDSLPNPPASPASPPPASVGPSSAAPPVSTAPPIQIPPP